MNTQETKIAAEVMRRAAEGEIVQYKAKSETWNSCAWSPDIAWNWAVWDYRILDFPEPPEGQKWQNPHNLTATQVGVHEGWRLLLKSELGPSDGRWFNSPLKDREFWYYSKTPQKWMLSQGGINQADRESSTYRTKAPLPKPKPTPEEMERIEMERLASRCEEECRHYGETHGQKFVSGWKAAMAYAKANPAPLKPGNDQDA